jgi:hypothetical protein
MLEKLGARVQNMRFVAICSASLRDELRQLQRVSDETTEC